MPSALRTYVFTDIVGFGEVLRQDDAAAAAMLRTYRRIVRRHIPSPPAATVQEVVADTFHIAFRSPGVAVASAIDIVRSIDAYNARTTSRRLAVKIGIHAGETIRQGRDFVGSAVEIAMRLAHAGRPGQILTTETIHGLVRTANIAPIEDRGVWGPHGLGQTVHVYEVLVPGRPASADGEADSGRRLLVTVLFTDIVRSTDMRVELGGRAWAGIVERHHSVVRDALKRWDGREVDTAGDGFFATFDSPSRAIRCALDLRDALRGMGISVRAGIHVGECEIVAGKVGGVAVVVGARIREAAKPGEVLVSQTVKDVVSGERFVLESRATRSLKGIPGRWRLYAAASSS